MEEYEMGIALCPFFVDLARLLPRSDDFPPDQENALARCVGHGLTEEQYKRVAAYTYRASDQSPTMELLRRRLRDAFLMRTAEERAAAIRAIFESLGFDHEDVKEDFTRMVGCRLAQAYVLSGDSGILEGARFGPSDGGGGTDYESAYWRVIRNGADVRAFSERYHRFKPNSDPCALAKDLDICEAPNRKHHEMNGIVQPEPIMCVGRDAARTALSP